MKKNERTTPSIRAINRELPLESFASTGETDETLAGRLGRAVTVFSAIRPLLEALVVLPILPKRSRLAVSVFVESLDALTILAAPGDDDDVADFKAGRDL